MWFHRNTYKFIKPVNWWKALGIPPFKWLLFNDLMTIKIQGETYYDKKMTNWRYDTKISKFVLDLQV